ncbi:MAG TPA: FtsW/RodA/SpoVE family cell cycle protein [Solirubrobacteraceae bacterium]|jgi:rod shape determining protein RodA
MTPPALSPLQASEQTAQETSAGISLPFDPLLTLAVIGLGICSALTLKVATAGTIPGDPHYFFKRQIVYLIVGFLAMLGVSRLDYGWLRRFQRPIYALLILSILAVLALGSETLGSTRSISLPGFSFQSSEIGKLLLIVFLSGFVVDRARRLRDRDTTIKVLALALVPTILVFKEPDIGSGLVFIAIALTILFVAGVPWRHIAAILLLGVIALTIVLAVAPALGVHLLQKYEVERLTGFLNPTAHVENKLVYQELQSKIAIGAGRQTGMAGVGSSEFGLVPERETDFIFASLSVARGFVGAAFVLSLYALMIWRGLRILSMAKDLYGSLIAGGVVAMLMFQVFVNVGVTIGILPITGITLPLMSYGGSSVLSTMLAVGLLQSIYLRARSTEAMKGRVLRW